MEVEKMDEISMILMDAMETVVQLEVVLPVNMNYGMRLGSLQEKKFEKKNQVEKKVENQVEKRTQVENRFEKKNQVENKIQVEKKVQVEKKEVSRTKGNSLVNHDKMEIEDDDSEDADLLMDILNA
eukprot:TRINITY_DN10631_c1_g1_i1.p1 TRINITY_DN10631_c1_g1~~TRINITY_DN10631_c1_g1_i1.p1  ORF type:complete len:126 (-),score=40.06 TRINITY_DN10631_c1_g1_i1:21-398(-)